MDQVGLSISTLSLISTLTYIYSLESIHSHIYHLYISILLYLLYLTYSLFFSPTLSCIIISFTSQSTTLLLRDGLTQTFAEALLRCVEDLLVVAKAYYAFIRVDMDEVSPSV